MVAEMNSDVKDDRSIAAQVAAALAARIVSGAIAPGERLRQDQFAAEFGASHVPVREAFKRLEAQGLVVQEPRRGVRVAPLDADAVIEVAHMRAALESLALRAAMPRLTEAHLSLAAKLLDGEGTTDDIVVLEDLNQRFHRTITEPCGMPRLNAAIADLHRTSARHLFATWKFLDWRAKSGDEHRGIMAAIRANDVDASTELLSAHIVAAGEALAAALRSQLPVLNQAP
jgi:DNA-binding GntR family transcriptional regulator